MINIELLKDVTKQISKQYKDDRIIQYIKNSMAHSKDWTNIVAGYSVLREHMKEIYNIDLT